MSDRRMRSLENARLKVEKKIHGATAKGKTRVLPGEIKRKKMLAVILRVSGYDFRAIGATLSEDRNTVADWFTEPEVLEYYEITLDSLKEAGRTYLEHLGLKALRILEEILDEEGDNAIRLNAVKEILDRGGYPKESRVQKESHQTTEEKTTFGSIDEVSKLRELPVEKQEEAAQMIEKLQEMLNEAPE